MEQRAPSIAGGFIKPDPPAVEPTPMGFDPKNHAFALYVDGHLVPLGAEPTVQFDDQNACVVFVTTVDALRGLTSEAIMQRAYDGWRTGQMARYQEERQPLGGLVRVKHFVMPEEPDGPIKVVVTVMSQVLFSYTKAERLGVRGDDILIPISTLKHPS